MNELAGQAVKRRSVGDPADRKPGLAVEGEVLSDLSFGRFMMAAVSKGDPTGLGTLLKGYTFTAVVTNGTPDSFTLVIKKSDGSTYYSIGPKNISGGDLVIQKEFKNRIGKLLKYILLINRIFHIICISTQM